MCRKLIVMVLSLAAALAISGTGGAGAQNASSLRGCPELVSACYPIGQLPVASQPSGERTRSALQPATDSRGQSVWRAGRWLAF